MDEAPQSLDPREELLEIAASVRALVSYYEGAGTWGLPRFGPGAEAGAGSEAGAGAGAGSEAGADAYASTNASANMNARAYANTGAGGHGQVETGFAAPQTFAAPQASTRAQTPAFTAPAFALPPSVTQAAARPAAARLDVLSPEERVERLHLLQTEVSGCRRCGLAVTRTNTVFSRGNPLSELCFVGEGPGFEEDQSGEPFVGPAGQLLDKMIAAMGYGREDVYICNIVKCRPPENRKPDADEMEACRGFLTMQLELVRPKFIVALGATAIQGLVGTTEGITRLRGKWKMYKGVPVMPTFHPAYLLRQPSAKRDVWNDLQEVMARLGKKPRTRA